VLAADGAFLPGRRFVALPQVPERLLAEGFRRAVLDFLVENEALSEDFRGRMLAWRYINSYSDPQPRFRFPATLLHVPPILVPPLDALSRHLPQGGGPCHRPPCGVGRSLARYFRLKSSLTNPCLITRYKSHD